MPIVTAVHPMESLHQTFEVLLDLLRGTTLGGEEFHSLRATENFAAGGKDALREA